MGSFGWIGHLEGVEYGQVVLMATNGLLAGKMNIELIEQGFIDAFIDTFYHQHVQLFVVVFLQDGLSQRNNIFQ